MRVSRNGIILVEFDDDKGDPLGSKIESNWIRDYRALFEKYSLKVHKRAIRNDIWPGKWAEFGKIITVYLNNQ